MTRATVLQEVRQMRVEELYARQQRRELTMDEAAEMLGVTARTFRRLGRASARAVPVDEALRMVTLYETRYMGRAVLHAEKSPNYHRTMADSLQHGPST